MRKSKGQITVFIVLIFHLLFICLAMVINIGLVVHDKINLQNSVDLAALYAAQRQAEILSAMAHINYQIRQSYKLMAWRYLVLGNIGANAGDGSITGVRRKRLNNYPSSYATNEPHCTNLRKICHTTSLSTNCRSNHLIEYCPYAVCFWHPDWFINGKIAKDQSHYCQLIDQLGVGGLKSPRAVIVAPNTTGRGIHESAVRESRISIESSCKYLGLANWRMASSFLYSFRIDQMRRKRLILDLYNKVFKNKIDIEGQAVQKGVTETIKNNLTFINYKNFQDRLVNMEYHVPENFNQIFKWQEIDPILFYINDTQQEEANHICPAEIQAINHLPVNVECNGADEHLCLSSRMEPQTGPLSAVYPAHLSSGFYKTESNDVFYVKVSVNLKYKRQIFFPFSDTIDLKAIAYAKPFGARFGPPQNEDTQLPEPYQSGRITPDIAQKHMPNYSLYPGDKLGLTSRKVQWMWAKAFKLHPQDEQLYTLSPADQQSFKELFQGKTFTNYVTNGNFYDPVVVARHHNTDRVLSDHVFNAKIRILEEMAIAPDLFDLVHYTILPNYMTTFYPKMQKNNFLNLDPYDGVLPSDLGHPAGQLYTADFTAQPKCYGSSGFRPLPFRLNYIEKQIRCTQYMNNQYMENLSEHKIKNIDHLLTSWAPPQQRYSKGKMYTEDPPFAHCILDDRSVKMNPAFIRSQSGPQKLLPYHCLKGGRSGFSVKLFSPQMLN